jgi:hypothetical protein
MGLLNLFGKANAALIPLPRGSFTVDCDGRVLASTLPQAFPVAMAEEIALEVLAAFRAAKAAQIKLGEFIIRYANLKLTARELRGGAIIFLAPQTLSTRPE